MDSQIHRTATYTKVVFHMSVLKIAKGENMKGSTQSVSNRLMRRSHGFYQSPEEQLMGQKVQQCLPAS